MLCSQNWRYRSSHSLASLIGAASRRQGRHCASRLRLINPVRSNTFRCLVIDGAAMENGSESSLTVVSPSASRARIARLVGSDRAAKVSLKRSRNVVHH